MLYQHSFIRVLQEHTYNRFWITQILSVTFSICKKFLGSTVSSRSCSLSYPLTWAWEYRKFEQVLPDHRIFAHRGPPTSDFKTIILCNTLWSPYSEVLSQFYRWGSCPRPVKETYWNSHSLITCKAKDQVQTAYYVLSNYGNWEIQTVCSPNTWSFSFFILCGIRRVPLIKKMLTR